MGETLGIGIIGAGRVAGAHIRAVQSTPGTRLVAVVDADLARARRRADEHGCEALDDYRRLLERDDVHLVMIGLPHWLHHEVTVNACRAGKHVFLEKPMADSVAECDDIINAQRESGVKLLVAHTQRYFASSIAAKRIVDSGELGRIVFATDTWYKSFGLEGRPAWFLDRNAGGGMWLMNGAHMIDRVAFMVNSRVAAVKAYIGNPIYNLKADDSYLALLQFENGVHATIVHAGWKKGIDRCEVELVCTEGMLKFDSYSNQLYVGKEGTYEAISVERHDPFARELAELVAAIQTNSPLSVTPEYGRHIVQVLEACEESSRTRREVMIGE